MKSNTRRRRKLILPRLQLKLIASFAGIAVLAMLLQFLILGSMLTRTAAGLEDEGPRLAAEVPGILLSVLGISLAILLPIMVGFGILFTFRIAGPLHRFEVFLNGVLRGEHWAPCRIRRRDDLQRFCGLLNEVTAAERERIASERPRAEDPEPTSSAA